MDFLFFQKVIKRQKMPLLGVFWLPFDYRRFSVIFCIHFHKYLKCSSLAMDKELIKMSLTLKIECYELQI